NLMSPRLRDSSATGADGIVDRSLVERSNLVLALARVLHCNGQSTHETVEASKRLSTGLGLNAMVIPHWSDLQLQATDGDARLVSLTESEPTGVNMGRVARAMNAIKDARAGRLSMFTKPELIEAIAHAPASPAWLFTIAAAAGAAALSVIFGVRHPVAVALIMISAAAGAIVRRA